MSIAAFPSAGYSGFEAMMYLVPKAGMPSGPDDPSVDWDSSHVVYFTVTANASMGSFIPLLHSYAQIHLDMQAAWVRKILTADHAAGA